MLNVTNKSEREMIFSSNYLEWNKTMYYLATKFIGA